MAHHNFKDITGQTFNRLTVIERIGTSKHRLPIWKCRCKCGNTVNVISQSLKTGNTQSCGCLNRERSTEANFKHGMCDLPEYEIWCKILHRCNNPNNKAFSRYGGRGIKVYPKWQNDFTAFFKHIGKKPTPQHTIERIDNSKGYFPGNVRWATRREQANNTRRNHYLVVRNWKLSIAQWARFVGINCGTLYSRIRLGWPQEKAIFYPVKHRSS